MKKIFAILLVLALIAGFVFAETTPETENHYLRVYSEVGEKVPAFQLRYSTVVRTNSGAVKFTNGTSYTEKQTNDDAANINFDISDISTEDKLHSAAFTVYLVKNSEGYKCKVQ